MGLKRKAGELKKAGEVRERLADAVKHAGRIDLEYAVEATGADKDTVMKAAEELEKDGILKVEKHFMGKTEFVSQKPAEEAGGTGELLNMVEERGSVKLKNAAAAFKMSEETALQHANNLMEDGLVSLNKRFLRGYVIRGRPLNIARYRIDESVRDRRKQGRVVYGSADTLLELTEKTGGLTVEDASNVLDLPRENVEALIDDMGDLLELTYPANPLASPKIKPGCKRGEGGGKPREGKVLDSYGVEADGVPANIRVVSTGDESMPIYDVERPEIGRGTRAVLKTLMEELSTDVKVNVEDISDPKKMYGLKDRFHAEARKHLRDRLNLPAEDLDVLAGITVHRMFGLGDIEMLMHDDWLEEVCVNTSHFPVTAYHKRFGWVKTSIILEDERRVYNYAAQIGRKVERDITSLDPIMDAHLLSGDRVNATLFPISNFGNTITIRKFARQPWTVTHYVSEDLKTLNTEMAAFLWLCFQYELNVIVGGGTASGKTSMLNSLCSLIQPTHRIITIEDTRELNLPKYLKWNWVPLTTREPNPEGKGEVSMLDLLVNALRMRPDRIVMGEIRKREEAEVLFEAMHTGHSVYSTIHADTAENLKRRLIEPPIEIPSSEIEALHLMVVVYRDRRMGERRVFEIAEIIPGGAGREFELNYLYRWNSRDGKFAKVNESKRVMDELGLHAGMTRDKITEDLKEKQEVLAWMVDNNVKDLNSVGEVIDEYYRNPGGLLKKVRGK